MIPFSSRLIGLLFLAAACVRLPCAGQVPGDERWDVRFGYAGTDASLMLAVATRGEDVYVGGDMLAAGGKNLARVGRWDGSSWSGLGSGIKGSTNFTFVYSLAWMGNNLYAGGIFTNAGGVEARGLAKWDGTNWSALPGGFNGYGLGLAVSGSDLYVAGIFQIGADTNNYGFARFDGTTWTTFGSTFSGCVGTFCTPVAGTILIDGPDIYVGGQFNTFAGITANSLVKWNGSSWSALGTGFGGTNVFVQGLARFGGDLIAAGGFTSADGVPATNLARWNGSAWSGLGGANNTLQELIIHGGHLYAVGNFTQIAGIAANRIARWDGVTWSALGTGLSGTANNLAFTTGGDAYVVGGFASAGSDAAVNVARWSGGDWSGLDDGLGNGMNRAIGFVRAFDAVGDQVYAGGSFVSAGGVLANRVARWNGASWNALGSGIGGSGSPVVRAIAHVGGSVYFGGTFTNAGGLLISNVACWNGANWTALGAGVNSNVNALATSGTDLYVGGAFTAAGGGPVNRVAKWTGAGWLTLGSGMNSNVNALATAPNGDVYAGGLFTTAGGVPANKVARWNNATGWTPLGNGINFGNVLALAVRGNDVYVGGNFTFADSITVNHVARWSGTSWFALGSGIEASSTTAQVTAIEVHGQDVYVGGTITNASGVPVRALARWDGANWHSLGGGLTTTPGSPAVNALLAVSGGLWVGGNLSRAGNRPAANLARWILDPIQIHLSAPMWDSGEFRFHVRGLLGLKYRVENSANLTTWTPVWHGCSLANDLDFSSTTGLPRTYFRVVAEP